MTPTTIPELLFASFDRFEREAHYGYKSDGAWRTLSTAEMRDRVRTLAGSLTKAGVGPGDRVGIFSETRLEWALVDYAALLLGAVVVPLYPNLTAAQSQYILEHAGVGLLFVANRTQHETIASIQEKLPKLTRMVIFDDEPATPHDGVTSLADFLADTGPVPEAGPKPDDLASIIYTSGTTGDPKGVMLSHANIVSNVLACTEACPYRSDDRQLTFLPLSHIFERMVHYYMLWNGVTVYFVESLTKVIDSIRETEPTVLTAVPRVLEKVLGSVEEKARPGPGLAPKIARFAIDTAREYAVAEFGARGGAPAGLKLRRMVADKLVFGKVRKILGGRLRRIVTGGAATPGHVTEFFNGIGIGVLPGYGLTESSPVIAFNTEKFFRFGTVGKPVPGCEVRIAEDGEILARGPNIMLGYYQNDEGTRAVLSDDGWLSTGDIGTIDADGYLSITDRKKDLLVTSNGKNIAPQPIEQQLIEDPMISQAMLVGDSRAYITALIVPEYGVLAKWAEQEGLGGADVARLLADPKVRSLYKGIIGRRCVGGARFEQIKKFALLDAEFSADAGELTPTLKIKRRVVQQNRAEVIESLYR